MLTAAGKLALKTVMRLAELAPEETISGVDLAAAIPASKKFMERGLNQLRLAKIVETRKGAHGGYRLARPASQIRPSEVIRAVEGPLAPILCASRTGYVPCDDCGDVERCAIRHMMRDVRDAMIAAMDERSIENLRRGP